MSSKDKHLEGAGEVCGAADDAIEQQGFGFGEERAGLQEGEALFPDDAHAGGGGPRFGGGELEGEGVGGGVEDFVDV